MNADNLKTKFVVARARKGEKSKIVAVEVMDITDVNESKKPGYNAPVVRNPHRDMLASITTIDGNEVATWFHKGKHVFTVTTFADGTMKYRSAI